MNINGRKVLLTGAAGGIGQQLALQLAKKGAHLFLLDRNTEALGQLSNELNKKGVTNHFFSIDLTDNEARNNALDAIIKVSGGIDLLINGAGLLSFKPLEDDSPELVSLLMQLNLVVPMLITQKILPVMKKQSSGYIINIGSTFGSIGFPWFSAYSASKSGLRGFSEAMRRELKDTGIKVSYIAPRAVKTALNTSDIMEMSKAVNMNMDTTQWVAAQILKSIEKEKKESFLGFPESLFVRINAIFPRLVDMALIKQTRQMEPFARKS